MAKRTDEQIAEYMRHYSVTTDKYQALETLARVEGKTEGEIIEICGKYGVNIKSKWGGGRPALTEEKREEVKAAIREGLTLTQVAERCKVGSSTAGRIRVEMQNSGEKLPKNVGGHKATAKYKANHPEEAEPKLPEAYPGQIYDDGEKPAEPEPIVEEDVKVFIPGEQAEEKKEQQKQNKPVPLAKALSDFADSCHNLLFGEQEETKPENGTARDCSQPSLWFALRDSLSEYLLGTFGAGTELTGEIVEPDAERLVIRFKTADGKLMRCTLRAEGKNGK